MYFIKILNKSIFQSQFAQLEYFSLTIKYIFYLNDFTEIRRVFILKINCINNALTIVNK